MQLSNLQSGGEVVNADGECLFYFSAMQVGAVTIAVKCVNHCAMNQVVENPVEALEATIGILAQLGPQRDEHLICPLHGAFMGNSALPFNGCEHPDHGKKEF
jgi:hypothetical protein